MSDVDRLAQAVVEAAVVWANTPEYGADGETPEFMAAEDTLVAAVDAYRSAGTAGPDSTPAAEDGMTAQVALGLYRSAEATVSRVIAYAEQCAVLRTEPTTAGLRKALLGDADPPPKPTTRGRTLADYEAWKASRAERSAGSAPGGHEPATAAEPTSGDIPPHDFMRPPWGDPLTGFARCWFVHEGRKMCAQRADHPVHAQRETPAEFSRDEPHPFHIGPYSTAFAQAVCALCRLPELATIHPQRADRTGKEKPHG